MKLWGFRVLGVLGVWGGLRRGFRGFSEGLTYKFVAGLFWGVCALLFWFVVSGL